MSWWFKCLSSSCLQQWHLDQRGVVVVILLMGQLLLSVVRYVDCLSVGLRNFMLGVIVCVLVVVQIVLLFCRNGPEYHGSWRIDCLSVGLRNYQLDLV